MKIGTPHKLPYTVKCRICSRRTDFPTKVCAGCSHLAIGRWADDSHTRIIFSQFGNPSNEWEYILPKS